jgi:hypothetical protein
MRNEKVFYSVKEESSIIHTIKRRKAVGHILPRNCHLKHAIQGKTEGRMEVKGRRGRKRKQLLITLRITVDTGI